MNCPHCKKEMRVSHTFTLDEGGSMQRCVCDDCVTVVTAHVVVTIVNVDPGYGEGAAAIAKKRNAHKEAPKAGAGVRS